MGDGGVDKLLTFSGLLACSINFRMLAILDPSQMLRLKASLLEKVDFPYLQLLNVGRELVLQPVSARLGSVK